jgi:glycosyltransferase involved in cell wall biosynthesis
MPPDRPRVAFHAPLKPPDHANPSGDRTIARLLLTALDRAGFDPFVASSLRTLDRHGDAAEQSRLRTAAQSEATRLADQPPPALWFSYHTHYKAPDLLGPVAAHHWGVPYVIAEASHAPARLNGSWAGFAEANVAAIRAADRLFWTTPRDLQGLAGLVGEQPLVPLPAFLDIGPEPAEREQHHGPLRLLAVGMMREGDKQASYRALATALTRARVPFMLEVVGDGAVRPEVERLFKPFDVRFHGAIHDPALLRRTYEAADLLVWPGVGEGVGMTYLEAQAAAVPCLAEDHPAQRALLASSCWRTPPGDADAFAAAIAEAEADRARLAARGRAARAHMLAHHSLDAAARTLNDTLMSLVGDPL